MKTEWQCAASRSRRLTPPFYAAAHNPDIPEMSVRYHLNAEQFNCQKAEVWPVPQDIFLLDIRIGSMSDSGCYRQPRIPQKLIGRALVTYDESCFSRRKFSHFPGP